MLCTLTAAASITAAEARKIAALNGAGFTNRFATDKARQGACDARPCCRALFFPPDPVLALVLTPSCAGDARALGATMGM